MTPWRPATGAAEAGPFSKADPAAARNALGGAPLTVRIGYQGPNARLAVNVGVITKSCAAAGITVADVILDTSGPQALKDGKIDALLASTGGATGSGSTGSSALDAYDLHTGNGNNLSGYSESPGRQRNRRAGGLGRHRRASQAADRDRAGTVGRHAHSAAVPAAAHAADLEENVRGEQEPDPLGRGLEHGPMGPDTVRLR